MHASSITLIIDWSLGVPSVPFRYLSDETRSFRLYLSIYPVTSKSKSLAESCFISFDFINRSKIQGSRFWASRRKSRQKTRTRPKEDRTEDRQDHVYVTCFASQRFLLRVVAIDNLNLKLPLSLDETLNRVAGAFTQPPPKATTAFEPWNFEA